MGLPTCFVIDPLNCFITLEIVGANQKIFSLFTVQTVMKYAPGVE